MINSELSKKIRAMSLGSLMTYPPALDGLFLYFVYFSGIRNDSEFNKLRIIRTNIELVCDEDFKNFITDFDSDSGDELIIGDKVSVRDFVLWLLDNHDIQEATSISRERTHSAGTN